LSFLELVMKLSAIRCAHVRDWETLGMGIWN
jgi:hypothetical protein